MSCPDSRSPWHTNTCMALQPIHTEVLSLIVNTFSGSLRMGEFALTSHIYRVHKIYRVPKKFSHKWEYFSHKWEYFCLFYFTFSLKIYFSSLTASGSSTLHFFISSIHSLYWIYFHQSALRIGFTLPAFDISKISDLHSVCLRYSQNIGSHFSFSA